jgi:intein/homing endonuclease
MKDPSVGATTEGNFARIVSLEGVFNCPGSLRGRNIEEYFEHLKRTKQMPRDIKVGSRVIVAKINKETPPFIHTVAITSKSKVAGTPDNKWTAFIPITHLSTFYNPETGKSWAEEWGATPPSLPRPQPTPTPEIPTPTPEIPTPTPEIPTPPTPSPIGKKLRLLRDWIRYKKNDEFPIIAEDTVAFSVQPDDMNVPLRLPKSRLGIDYMIVDEAPIPAPGPEPVPIRAEPPAPVPVGVPKNAEEAMAMKPWLFAETPEAKKKREVTINARISTLKKLKPIYEFIGENFGWYKAFDRDIFCSVFLIPNGSMVLKGVPGCCTGDAMFVQADGGIVSFDEFSFLPPGLYPIDQEVLCNGTTANSPMLHIYEVDEVIEVESERGKTLTLTPNHPLMTRSGWKQAQDIDIGEEIMVLQKIPSPEMFIPTNFSVERFSKIQFKKKGLQMREHKNHVALPGVWDGALAFVFGCFIAEGTLDLNRVTFVIGADEDEFREKIMEEMAHCFGVSPHIKPRKRKAVEIQYQSKELWQIFQHYKYFCQKTRVPVPILRSPNSVVSKFLSALFEGDGSVYHKADTRRVQLKSTSKRLIDEVQTLLLRFGISANIFVEQPKNKTWSASYVLDIGRKEDLLLFQKNIGFVSHRKKDRLQKLLSSFTDKKCPKKKSWELIISKKKKTGKTKVYDIEVPATRTFITKGGIVSHNTGKTQLIEMASLLFANDFKTGAGLDILNEKKESIGKATENRENMVKWLEQRGVLGSVKHNADKEIQDVFFYTRINIERYTKEGKPADDAVVVQNPLPKIWQGSGFGEIPEQVDAYNITPIPRPIVTSLIKFHNECNRMNANVADTLLGLMSEQEVEYQGKKFFSPVKFNAETNELDYENKEIGSLSFFDYNPHLEVENPDMELDRALLDRITVGMYLSGGSTALRFDVMDKKSKHIPQPREVAFHALKKGEVEPLTRQELTNLWYLAGKKDPAVSVDAEVMAWIAWLTNLPNLTNRQYGKAYLGDVFGGASHAMKAGPEDENQFKDVISIRGLPIDRTLTTFKPALERMDTIEDTTDEISEDPRKAIDELGRPLGVRGAESLLAILRAHTVFDVVNKEQWSADDFVLYIKDDTDRDRIFDKLCEALPYVLDHRINLGVGPTIQSTFLSTFDMIKYYFVPLIKEKKPILYSIMDALMAVYSKDLALINAGGRRMQRMEKVIFCREVLYKQIAIRAPDNHPIWRGHANLGEMLKKDSFVFTLIDLLDAM